MLRAYSTKRKLVDGKDLDYKWRSGGRYHERALAKVHNLSSDIKLPVVDASASYEGSVSWMRAVV